MANASSRTTKSTTEIKNDKLQQDLKNDSLTAENMKKGETLKTSDVVQLELTKEQMMFLGTLIIEGFRMSSVRDGSPSKFHFKNLYPIVEELYNTCVEDTTNG